MSLNGTGLSYCALFCPLFSVPLSPSLGACEPTSFHWRCVPVSFSECVWCQSGIRFGRHTHTHRVKVEYRALSLIFPAHSVRLVWWTIGEHQRRPQLRVSAINPIQKCEQPAGSPPRIWRQKYFSWAWLTDCWTFYIWIYHCSAKS